jgi:hypothetical protein
MRRYPLGSSSQFDTLDLAHLASSEATEYPADAVSSDIRACQGPNFDIGRFKTGSVSLFEIIGVPYLARASAKNHHNMNEVGHSFFRRFSRVFGMSVPPTRISRSYPHAIGMDDARVFQVPAFVTWDAPLRHRALSDRASRRERPGQGKDEAVFRMSAV